MEPMAFSTMRMDAVSSRFGQVRGQESTLQDLTDASTWRMAPPLPRMGSWTWDLNTRDIQWSDELYHILGFNPQVDKATLEAFEATVHPDDRETLERERARQIETGRNRSVECRIVRGDGSIREVLLDGAHIRDETGSLRKVVGTVVDITDMRRAEREAMRNLSLLNESQRVAQVGSFFWDPAANHFQWTDSLYAILGLPVGMQGNDEALMERVIETDREAVIEARRQALLHGAAEPVEFGIRRSDGALRLVQMQYRRVDGANDSRPTFLGTLYDVTHRRELEESLRQSRKMEAIGRLAGGVAHDFNNLLTIIMGCVESLQEKDQDPRLHQIAHAAELGSALTRQLLAFSRQSVIQPEPLQLNDVVSGMAQVIQRLIGEDIRLNLNLAEGSTLVYADPHQIEQILLNLAVNSRDAMPQGGTIDILTYASLQGAKTGAADALAHEVGLTFKDDGMGMSEEVRLRIFEPFFTTKQAGKGTGLGLATVFGIVSQAGGHIEVQSKVGEGSTFHVHFPAYGRDVAVTEPMPSSTKGGREMVLVVEDNDKLREVVYEFLDGAGYRVQAFGRPSEALAWFREHHLDVDVLVTDVLMPEKNGRRMAEEMLELRPGLRALFISGYSGDLADPMGFPGGFLQKPFRKKELLDALRSVLSQEGAMSDGA
jgi:two-component system, cell cycle sensor histidine kinase and response regulator CckA